VRRVEAFALVAILAACTGSGDKSATETPMPPSTISTQAPAPTADNSTTTVTEDVGSRVVEATEYSSAQEIAEVMDASGFGCDEWIVQDLEGGEFSLDIVLVDDVACLWPPIGVSLPRDRINVVLLETERHRLNLLLASFLFGCGALNPPPQTLAYVHGHEWVVISGWGETGVAIMEKLASELGGQAGEIACVDLNQFAESIENEANLANMSVDDIKQGLGEQ
jgi:hypothetical protein